MSQMPEVAGSWPEEGAQYVPGAPMEPVQQAYPPQAPYQHQQPYQQQGYQEPQYHQAQQQYPPQQQYQEQTVPQQAMFAEEEEQSSVPSEFDHLFRDSSPQERRSITGRQPMVSGPGAAPSPGFPQQQAQQQQAPQMQATQVAPQASNNAMYHQAQQQTQMQGYEQAGQQQTQYVGQFGGGGGYDGQGGPGGSGSGSRRTPLIIGGVVVVIAAVGLYFGLSGGGSAGKSPAAGKASATASAPSNETAQQQADAVYNLVKQAKTLRSDINGGVNKLLACDISGAQSEINSTAQARASAVTQVAALPVTKISGGASVVSALKAAWQDSATSDQDYAKAASDFASGQCSEKAVKADSNYQAAVNGSGTSESAKVSAASVWDSVMSKYEPSISESDL